MPKWIASIGKWDMDGNPKYRAHHFEAEDISEAVVITNQDMVDGEWVYEIRMRKEEN